MGIRLKLLLPGVTAWIVLALTLNLYWLPEYLVEEMEGFRGQQQRELRLLDIALLEPLLQGNLAQVHTTLDQILGEHDDWRSLIVRDPAGRRLYPLAEPPSTADRNLVTLRQTVRNLDHDIAVIELVADPRPLIDEETANVNRLNLILLVLLTLAIMAGTMVQTFLIRRPLTRLAKAAKQLAGGNFEAELPRASRDEVGRLSQAFQVMRRNLSMSKRALENEAQSARKAATALRKSEERFALAVRGTNDGIWDWDLLSGEVYFSPRWKEMLGFEEHEIENNFVCWRDLVHPADLGLFLVAWTDYMEGITDTLSLEYRMKMKTGGYAWILCRGLASWDEQGNAVRLSGSQTDITERRHIVEALRREWDRTQHYLNAMEVMMIALDREGAITLVNRKGCEILGYKEDGLIGKNWFMTCLPTDKQEVALHTFWVLMSEGLEPYEYCEDAIITRTGEERIIAWHHSLLYDDSGKLKGMLSSGGDITEHRQMERERKLLQGQLQQAQKMEAVGQLTGGIAHDFNNILAAIIGYTELALERCVEDGVGDEKLSQYLRQVDYAGKQARNLIAQMLAFSRGGTNEPEPLPLPPLLKESLKMLGSTLPSSIELHTRIEEGIPLIMMDPVLLHQMVMNLCINSRDAMQGRGQIDIQLRRRIDIHEPCASCHKPASGDFVELSIQDRGCGIDLEMFTRVFDPFFTTKEVGKGSGMGLAMVHGIVHKLGGHLLVETAPGQGATFRLLFPALPEGTQTSDTFHVAMDHATGAGDNARILVVDDEESVAAFLGELFTSRGYQVTVQTDSRRALAGFKKNPRRFDLVLTDQTMPKLTGAELAQAMLALRPELPVILCTGYSEHIDEKRARTLGIRGYLNKPLETRVVMGLVRELLESRGKLEMINA